MHAPSFVQGAFVLAVAATAVTARALPGSTVLKRHPVGQDGDCSVQPAGAGPSPSTDTAEAFQAYPAFANAANGAATPSGYDALAVNQLSTVQHDSAYITYEEVTSYDVGYCAAQCNSKAGCTSFNIYFERDPILNSAPSCSNPASTTRIKCAYFSSCSTKDELTNDGQYCYDFHVVMAGSNTYNKKGGCAGPSTTTTTFAVPTTTTTTIPVISTTPATTPITTTAKISTTPVVPTTKATTTAAVSTTTKGWGNWPSTTAKASTTPVITTTTKAVTTPSTTKATTPATTPSTTKATTPATTKPTTLATTTKPAPPPATTTKAAATTTSCNKGGPSPPPQQNQPWNNWGYNNKHW